MVFLTIPAAVQGRYLMTSVGLKAHRNGFSQGVPRPHQRFSPQCTLNPLSGLTSADTLQTELLDYSPTNETDESAPAEESRIEICNAWFAWDHDQLNSDEVPEPTSSFVLRIDEELKFVEGGINLILGPSGSGKTTLLMALLGMSFRPILNCICDVADCFTGETYCRLIGEASYARLPRKGDIAFAAQESWVLSGTIRVSLAFDVGNRTLIIRYQENILFGSVFDEERYNKVIDQCALRQDLESFDGRDSTEVGERGITLRCVSC